MPHWGRWGWFLLLLGFTVALAPVIIILIQLNERVGLKDVTSYTEPVYVPEDSELCPGDTLAFTPTLDVTRAPLLVEVTASWWDVDNQRTAIQAKKGDVAISIFRSNRPTTRPLRIPVPQLPPGKYEYLRATESTTGSISAITSVPFVVPGNCPAPQSTLP